MGGLQQHQCPFTHVPPPPCVPSRSTGELLGAAFWAAGADCAGDGRCLWAAKLGRDGQDQDYAAVLLT